MRALLRQILDRAFCAAAGFLLLGAVPNTHAADFPSTGAFHARQIRDSNNVSVIELDGNYDKLTGSGEVHVEPRAVVAREFYKTHADRYDFLIVFSTFEFNTGGATAFHMGVRNDVKGIGKPLFDNSGFFGSNKVLQGYVDMSALTRYTLDTANPKFEDALKVFAHEFQHQWGMQVRYRTPDGAISSALIGQEGAHWSFLVDSGASLHYGHRWRDNGDGTFTSIASMQSLNPVDLYLMGVLKKEEVPPFFLIKSTEVDPTRLPEIGVTIHGERINVTIDDIIAAEGERIPNALQAKKDFQFASILLTRPGETVTDEQIAAVKNLVAAFQTRLAVLTGGRAIAHGFLQPKGLEVAKTPDLPTPGTGSSGAASAENGFAWLRARQSADGYWQDHEGTRQRDTMVALGALADVDGRTSAAAVRAREWIAAQPVESIDYLARRLLTLGPLSSDTDVSRLIASQNIDGGWGIAGGYLSNPLDTGWAILALAGYPGLDSAKLAATRATTYLLAHQNTDGGWGNATGGVSRTVVTTVVMRALGSNVIAKPGMLRASAFLGTRQNSDGGFGDSPSTVHDTANVVEALIAASQVDAIRATDAFGYIQAMQRSDGSWDGNTYSTALALGALKTARSAYNWTASEFIATPMAIRDGQQVRLSARVWSKGLAATPSGTLRFYDGDPAAGGNPIGAPQTISALEPGQQVLIETNWNTFGLAGARTLYAYVDPDSSAVEITRADNLVSTKVTVSPAADGMDLSVVAQDVSVGPSVINRLPLDLAVTANVSNLGKADASAVKVVLVKGADPNGPVLDQKTVVLLGRSNVPVTLTAPVTKADVNKLTVVIDPDLGLPDIDRTNNFATVTVASVSNVDLSVLPANLGVPSGTSLLGADLAFKARLSNFGTADSAPFQLVYSVSDGTTVREIARRTLQIMAGQTVENSATWRSDLAGALTLTVSMDPVSAISDIDRTNNQASSPTFTVVAAEGPNLAVSYHDSAVTPSPALEGRAVTIASIVRNTGNVVANNVEVGFYEGDPAIGGVPVAPVQVIPAIAPGVAYPVSATIPDLRGTADRLYFIVVDPAGKLSELSREDNQTFQVTSILSMADLAVSPSDIVLSPSAPKPGDNLSIRVNFSNLGQQASGPFVVRLYDGSVSGGVQIGSDVTIAGVDGHRAGFANFSVPLGAAASVRQFSVVLDPLGAVADKTRDNNTASIGVGVQIGNAYVSSRYLSPNGDGVLDTTSFSFHLDSGSAARVVVLDALDRSVRRYDAAIFTSATDGAVEWDGKDAFGAVVEDGDYRFQVQGASGAVLAEQTVAVDTNRISILKALGTERGYYRNLTGATFSHYSFTLMQVSPDEKSIYLDWFGSEDDGLLRMSASGGAPSKLLSTDQIRDMGIYYPSITSVASAPAGDRISLELDRSVDGYSSREAWVIEGDGKNFRPLLSSMPGSPVHQDYMTLSNSFLSEDGKFMTATVYVGDYSRNVVWRIPADGTGAVTTLFDGRSGEFSQISYRSIAPNRRRAVVYLGRPDYSPGTAAILDLETGLVRRLTKGGIPIEGDVNLARWTADARRLLVISPNWGAQGFTVRVFDEDGQQIQEIFEEASGFGGDSGGYGPQISKADWATSGNEFSYVIENGWWGSSAPSVVRLADVATGTVKTIATDSEASAPPAPTFASTLSSYGDPGFGWLPYHRDMLALGNRFYLNEAKQAVVPEVFMSYRPSILGFLPSGRKFVFTSSFDPATMNSCEGMCDVFSFESLDNLTADLRAVRSLARGGVILKGSASDLHFSRFSIEYASTATPSEWHAITPSSSTQVLDKELAIWAPPAYGTYFVRLTAEDLAGNKSQAIQRIVWSDTPSITNLYKNEDYISPNGDGVQDSLQIHYRVLEPVQLAFEVFDNGGRRVRLVEREHSTINKDFTFEWDGRNDAGAVVPDGKYVVRVLDFEFAVEVDSTVPVTSIELSPHPYNPSVLSGEVATPASIEFSSKETNPLTLSYEYMDAKRPGEWKTIFQMKPGDFVPPRLSLGDGSVEIDVNGLAHFKAGLALENYVSRRFRVVAQDKAGNTSAATSAWGSQELFLQKETWPLVIEGTQQMDGTCGRSMEPMSVEQDVPDPLLAFNDVPSREYFKDVVRKPAISLGKLNDYYGANPVNVELAFVGGAPAKVKEVWLEQRDTDPTKPDDVLTPVWKSDLVWDAIHGPTTIGRIGERQSENLFAVTALVSLGTDAEALKLRKLVRMVTVDDDGIRTTSVVYRLVTDDRNGGGDCTGGDFRWAIAADQMACGEAPSGNANLWVFDGPAADYVSVTRATPAGGRETLATVPVSMPNESKFISFSTKDWPVGEQAVTVSYFGSTEIGGTVRENVELVTKQVRFVVDRNIPKANLAAPLDGSRMCMQHERLPNGVLVNYLPIDGKIESLYGAHWNLELAKVDAAGTVGVWRTAEPMGIADSRSLVVRGGLSPVPVTTTGGDAGCGVFGGYHCRDTHPFQWASPPRKNTKDENYDMSRGGDLNLSRGKIVDRGTASGEIALINGLYSARLRVVGPSGAQQCTAPVSFTVDGIVEASVSIDRSLFSPNGDGVFDEATVRVGVDESIVANVTVLPAALVNKKPTIVSDIPVRVLSADQSFGVGETEIGWDGKNASGSVVPDGFYAIRVVLTDGCGNERVSVFFVEVDATPPALNISTPSTGSPVGLRTRVAGTVSDAHFRSYRLSYASVEEAAGGNWRLIQAGTAQIETENDIAIWNSDVPPGEYLLRLQAEDTVANASEKIVSVTVAERQPLVAALDAVPTLFSPNGDGRLDTTRIGFELLQSVKVKLELLEGAAVVATPINGDVLPKGPHFMVWDGRKTGGGTVADGNLTIRLTAQSVSGPEQLQIETFSIRADSTPPTVVVDNPLKAYVTGRQSIAARISDPLLDSTRLQIAQGGLTGSWMTMLDLGGVEAGLLSYGLADLPEGVYGMKVVATDLAENIKETSRTFEVDNTPPKVALSTPEKGAYISGLKGATEIKGSIEEKNFSRYKLLLSQGAPPVAAPVELSGASAMPAGGLVAYAWDVKASADGPYTLALWAEDLAEQTGETGINVIVDNTPPLAVLKAPAGTWYVARNAVIRGTASDENFQSFKLEIAPGTKAVANHWSEFARGTTAITDGVLGKLDVLPADGPATLRLTVIDKAGNTSETLSDIVVDTTPPAAPLNLAAELQNRQDARLTWNAVADSDLDGYALFRNGVRITPELLHATSYIDVGLKAGGYQYVVKAYDKAGNESAESQPAFVTVVLSKPVATVFVPKRGGYVSGLTEINGTATSPSDFKEYRLFVGEGAAPSSWQLIRRSPVAAVADALGSWNTLGYADGAVYSVKLEAEDLAGQTATDTVTVTVDNHPPAAPIALTATASGADVTVQWNVVTDPDLAGYILTRDERIANSSGLVIGSLAPYTLITNNYLDLHVADGKHTYYVQAIDKAGNLSDPSNSAQVTIDMRPPHVVIVQPLEGTSIDKTTYVVGSTEDTDIASVQFQYRPAGSGAWVNLGAPLTKMPWSVTWSTSGLPFGPYELRAVATDLSAQTDPAPEAVNVRITELNAPSPTVLSGHAIGGETRIKWEASTASDLEGYLLQRFDNESGYWTRLNDTPLKTLEYTDPDLRDLVYTYRVIVADKEGNESAPSNEVTLQVFTPQVEQPYTPTSAATTVVTGTTLASRHVVIERDGTRIAEIDADVNGIFAIPVDLLLGDGRFVLRAQDADGNISRDVAFHVLRATPPASPVGLTANVSARDVTLSWTANSEPDIAGYTVTREGVESYIELVPSAISASSVYYWPYAADRAVDGDRYTPWIPNFSTWYSRAIDWLEIGFAEPVLLDSVRLQWNFAPRDYYVEGFDGEVWVPFAHVVNSDELDVTLKLVQPYRSSRYRVRFASGVYAELGEISARAIRVVSTTTHTEIDVADGVRSFGVAALNTFGLRSVPSETRPSVGDATGPGAPVLGAAVLTSDVRLDWTPPSDTDVASYLLYRDDVLITTLLDPAQSSYVDIQLPNNTYRYQIVATDTVGNRGTPSNIATAVVAVAAPTAQLDLVAQAASSGKEVKLSWTVRSGAIPYAYSLQRAGTPGGPYSEIARLPALTYADTTVSTDNTYFYVVTGLDAAGNPGVVSNEAAATLRDVEPPQPPVFTAPATAAVPWSTLSPNVELRGLAEPGSRVEIKQNGAYLQTVFARDASAVSNFGSPVTINAYATTSDGRGAIVGSYDSLIWADFASGTSKPVTGVSYANAASFDATGKTAILLGRSTYYTPAVFVWHEGESSASKLGDISPNGNSLAVSADGKQVFLQGYDSGYVNRGLWRIDSQSGAAELLAASDSIGEGMELSPDDKTLAYLTPGTLNLMRLSDKSVRSIPLDMEVFNPAWLPSGDAILLPAYSSIHGPRLLQIDVSSAAITVLFESNNTVQEARPSPDGKQYLVRIDDTLSLRDFNGGITAVATNVSYNLPVRWDAGGEFHYASGYSNDLFTIKPAGLFVVPDVRLQVGPNVFDAISRDAMSNASPAAEPVQITLLTDNLSDLQVAASDIVSLPSAPIAGQAVETALRVRNLGADARDVVAHIEISDATGGIVLQRDVSIPTLGRDETRSTTLSWTPTTAGRYKVAVVLDPAHLINEISEDNNAASREVVVAGTAQPYIGVTVDAARYTGGSTVKANVAVFNPGAAFDGKATVRVEDADGYLVTELAGIDVRALGYSIQLNTPYNWATGSTLAGNYRISARLFDMTGNALASASAPFAIDTSRVLAASVGSDKSSYSQGEPLKLRGTTSYQAGNAALPGTASATLRLMNAAGTEVASRSASLNGLFPGAAASIELPVDSTALAPGSYHLDLTARDGSTVLAQAQTDVVIVPTVVSAVTGRLTISLDAIAPSESLATGFTLTNTGNLSIADMPVSVRVIDPSNGEESARSDSTASLAVGASRSDSAVLSATAGWPLKPLIVILEAKPASTAIELDRKTIYVVDRIPPVASFVTPENNALLNASSTPIVVRARDYQTRVDTVEISLDGFTWARMAPLSPSESTYVANGVLPNVDGGVDLFARATDVAGNVSAVAHLSVVIDKTPPLIVVAGVSEGASYTNNVTPLITVTDVNLLKSSAMLDGHPFVSGSVVSAGAHDLFVTADDKAGNHSEKHVLFTVATDVPVVAITVPVANVLTRTPLTVDAVATSPSGVAGVDIRVDGGAWQPTAATAADHWLLVLPTLSDGAHTLEARVTNAGGATATSAVVPVTIDNTPPSITIGGVTEGATYPATVAAAISVTDANLLSSAIKLDGVAYVPGASIGNGSHDLHIVADDKAGNHAEKHVTFNVALDVPTIAITAPLANVVTRTPLSVKAIAASQVGVDKVEMRIDGGVWQLAETAPDHWRLVLASLSDGLHTLEARVTNANGATTISAPLSVTIDNTPPVISITDVVDSAVYRVAKNPAFSVSDSNPDTASAQLDGSDFASGSAVGTTGAHTLVVTAVDRAGNTASKTVGFTIAPVALSGTLTLSGVTPPPGQALTIDASVLNSTFGAALDAQIDVAIRDAVTGVLATHFDETATLANTATYQKVRSWTVSGTPGTSYNVVLTAVVEGQTYTLATTAFTVGAQAVSIDHTVASVPLGKLLVYTRCKTDTDDITDACAPRSQQSYGTTTELLCTIDRVNYIDGLLTSLGIDHLVVSKEADFQREMRSGRYSTYWLSGGATRIENLTAAELKSAVYRGDMLLLDGLHEARNVGLEGIAGIRYNGAFPYSSTVVMDVLPQIFPASSFTLTKRPVKFENVLGGVYEASLKENSVMTNLAGIVSNAYGLGKTVSFAFDMGDAVQAGADKDRMTGLLQAALGYLTRTGVPDNVVAGSPLKQRASLDNHTGVIPSQFIEKLPAGAPMLSTKSGVSVTTDASGRSVLTWNASLPAGKTIFDTVLKAPLVAGNYVIDSTLNVADTGGTQQFYSSAALPVSVITASTLIDGAVTKLQGMSLTGMDSTRRTLALQLLGSAKLSVDAADWDGAMKYVLAAQVYAANILHADARDTAVLIARVVEAVERRM